MLVDYERVVLDLKRHIATKSHHGQRDLFALIGTLEAKHQRVEGLPERALRLYGVQFGEDLTRPTSQGGRVLPADGHKDRAQRGDSSTESEEDTHVSSKRSGLRAVRAT